MDPIIVISGFYKLAFAFVAVALLFGTLRKLDSTLGISFSEIMAELREGEGIPVAVYFGCRIIAVAILIGMALG